jgi:hypothetical protein
MENDRPPRREESRILKPFKYPTTAIHEAGRVSDDKHNKTPIKNDPTRVDFRISGNLRCFATFSAFSLSLFALAEAEPNAVDSSASSLSYVTFFSKFSGLK